MITNKMAIYLLKRSSEELDDYGLASSTPVSPIATEVLVSIFKNSPSKDSSNPLYDLTPYVGLTRSTDIKVGDILSKDGQNFQVKNIGDRAIQYQALFLIKL